MFSNTFKQYLTVRVSINLVERDRSVKHGVNMCVFRKLNYDFYLSNNTLIVMKYLPKELPIFLYIKFNIS